MDYDKSDFVDIPLVEAPEGFEAAVMAQIALLQTDYAYHVTRKRFSESLGVCLLGVISICAGLIFALVLNWEQFLLFTGLEPHLEALFTPVAAFLSNTATELTLALDAALTATAAYAVVFQFLLAGILTVLAGIQFSLYYKDSKEVECA